MQSKTRVYCVSVGLFLVTYLVACKQSTGTFVLLTFDGTVPAGKSIHSIELSLKLGTRIDKTTFEAPSGGVITLPTDATLQIGSGSGDLTVSANALASDQSLIATGTDGGPVTAGQTTRITVHFGAGNSDGGDGGIDGSLDAQQDGLVPGKDAGSDGPSGTAEVNAADSVSAPADIADIYPGRNDVASGGSDGATTSGGAGGSAGSDSGGATSGGSGGTASGGGGVGGSGGSAGGDSGATFQLSMTVATLDFGVVPVGSVSAPKTLIVTNVGGGTSPVLMLFVGDGHHFPVYQDRCSGAVLLPGGTCTVAFTFNPDITGSMQTDGSVGPPLGPATRFTLSGTAANGTPALSLSPNSVDFMTVDIGIASPVTFTVTNNGAADSGPIKILVNPVSTFQISNDGCSTVTLGNQGRCTFTLVFAPQTIGAVSATITAQTTSGLTASSTASGVGQDHVQLTLKFAGTGGGSVTGTNLNCLSGLACTVGFTRSSPSSLPTVDLSALANGSSLFSGWSGDCTGTSKCTMVMDASKTVTATFDAIPVQISLNVLGLAGQQGTLVSDDGAVTCASSCPAVTHAANPNFTLTAKPGPNSNFVGWTDGPCHGTSPTCTFALTGPTIISATFGPQSYMFVSSSTVVPGQLGGIAGADKECQRLATKASLPGNYHAWISVTGNEAKSRMSAGGWVRTDGRPFAKNLAALATVIGQPVYYPPRLDEMGNDLGNNHIYVATGGNVDGTALGSQCNGYTSLSGGLYVGDAATGSGYWAMRQLDSVGCGGSYHLYCFRGDGLVADVVPPVQPGRRIFVSAQPFIAGGSIAADQMCQADAAAANLANASQFLAFLSTSTTPAMKRIRASGQPWKRADDVFVVRQISDFAEGKLIATPGLVANGSLYSNVQVWTGASDPTVPGSGTCQDWKAGPATVSGIIGDGATTVAPDWFSTGITVPCNNSDMHLVCIEP
jgi:hypothetical protein